MDHLDRVIKHLQKIDHDFFGEVRIKIKQGKAVHIVVERSIKLDDEPAEHNGSTKGRT